MRSITTLGYFVLAFAIAGTGCRNSPQSGDPPGKPPATDYQAGPDLSFSADGSEVHITPAGTASADSVGLPADVPLLSDAEVTLAVRSSEGQFMTYLVALPGHEVRQRYIEQLASDGWEVTSQRSQDFTHELTAAKDDRTLHLLIDLNPAQDGSAQDGSAQDGLAQNDTAQDGATQVTLAHDAGDG